MFRHTGNILYLPQDLIKNCLLEIDKHFYDDETCCSSGTAKMWWGHLSQLNTIYTYHVMGHRYNVTDVRRDVADPEQLLEFVTATTRLLVA